MNLKIFYAAALLFSVSATAQSQPYADKFDENDYTTSCTSIIASKGATEDGSVITAHTCDSNYRTWVEIVTKKRFKSDETEPVFSGMLHNEEPWDMRNVVEKGRIPAISETYAYLNTAYPCMNEKQLAIGETTITGKKELLNKKGLFFIEELQRIALQRCSTARDAVLLIGRLAEDYGYCDSGECLTIADKKEVWQLEIFGSGAGKPSSVWVAQKLPEGHVGISANIPRISKVDFSDSDNYLYSRNIKEDVIRLGLWDGVGDFVFWKIASGVKPFSVREFFVLSKLAPSLNLSYESEELPFSVKPDKKVSVREIIALYRETYDGTEWDQIKGLEVEVTRYDRAKGTEYKEKVRPISTFMTNDTRALLNHLSPGSAPRNRTIAVIQCSYSHIIRLRDWLPDEIGGVAYFAFDNPAESPRIPIYAGETKLPKGFDICGQKRYRTDSAIWSFRETNRIATINWDATKEIVRNKAAQYEKKMMDETPELEKRAEQLIKAGREDEAIKLLEDYTQEITASEERSWQDMKADLWTIFARAL